MRLLRRTTVWMLLMPVAVGHAGPGQLIEEVQCRDSEYCSYMIYLPAGYMHHRDPKWPVLFVMGPEGGRREDLERYIKGAEKNRWIVAMSIESDKPSRKSEYAVAAMVNDVCSRFTIDMERCYASGMGGGARMAFWLGNEQKKMIIGIIPICGGDTGNRYRSQALAYGLCGGTSFTRWEMAVTFLKHIRQRGQLRFYRGGYSWADEDLIADAMTWLNAKYLEENGTEREIEQFSKVLYDEALNRFEENPYFTYRQAAILSELTTAPHAKSAREIAERLKAEPHIALYIDALKEMDRFVEKHFNTDPGDYRTKPLTQQQKEDADKLLEWFKTTPLAPVIREFGLPSEKP